ncbi:hypothetical protein DICPUDRAFT_155008 [Dictyostelium purpureum]|uniref:RRM domain-containing protein n=1 Tax=Dictyostelium purpureum TaxID=5786 RepID=F0ZSU1_DICPU|nr:uncharacterized protein DICPUDRAFT_155008 [Dictyostelium purpureum]EGC32981.1 hypothetical protein DICPUDRAFT_155008 [Dictyostelium purpureum]|eukprot:XP_003290499.1 hypothetical protein DICPUDRAFT_155008 [Dictyostelium purpureum]
MSSNIEKNNNTEISKTNNSETKDDNNNNENKILEPKPDSDSNNNNTENKVFKNKNNQWSYFSEKEKIYFIYDEINKQWYPEITKEMVESQQSIYKKSEKKRDKNQELEENISELYISGLPIDGSVREEEINKYLKKCGFVKKNEYGRPIINLYVDENNLFTGNALVSFERKESIPIAILQYDDTEIVPNHPIKLRKATLEESLSVNNATQNSNNNSNNKKKKQKKSGQDKRSEYENELKYGWADSESKTVIIKNLFSPSEAWEDPNFFNSLQADLEDETHGCAKCGEISSIHIFEYNPDGVVSVKFKEFESAESCVALMDGRFFGGRKLSADFYDGFTNYHVDETDEDKEIRLKKWEEYISKEEE